VSVRLDKFMKVSRLAKRRAEAKDGIEAGRITKDGRALKPGYEVKVGDVLVIHYRTKFLTVRIAEVPERVLPSLRPAELYEILDDRKDDAREWA
jgi:ribosomal 50S subunit-recycling heat shock protein